MEVNLIRLVPRVSPCEYTGDRNNPRTMFRCTHPDNTTRYCSTSNCPKLKIICDDHVKQLPDK